VKIAKTIAGGLRCEGLVSSGLPGYSPRTEIKNTNEVQQVITTHLAPIREALESASDFIEGTAQHGDICESRDGGACDCGLHTAMLHVQEALALMEEEG